MGLLTEAQAELLQAVSRSASRTTMGVYLVGGIVRDILLGKAFSDRDLDILIEGDAAGFARDVVSETGGELKLFNAFLTAKILNPTLVTSVQEIDFATARTETYARPGSLPEVTAATIVDDLTRRDFSINSMAISLGDFLEWSEAEESVAAFEEHLIDPFHGREDLRDRTIRVLHPASFSDDPTRMFRALRYAVRLDGKLDEVTAELLRSAVGEGALATISADRVVAEVKKALTEGKAASILEAFFEHHLLDPLLQINADQRDHLIELLRRHALGKSESDAFDYFLAISYTLLGEEHRETLFDTLKLGRKKKALVVKKSEELGSLDE